MRHLIFTLACLAAISYTIATHSALAEKEIALSTQCCEDITSNHDTSNNKSDINDIPSSTKQLALHPHYPHQHSHPSFLWGALVVAALSLCFNIYQFIHNKIKSKRDVADEYWLRTVAIPTCVNPLIAFSEEYALKLRSLLQIENMAEEIYDQALKEYQRDFQYEKELIIKRFYILSAEWNSIFQILSQNLDKLEDAIIIHCYINQSLSNADPDQVVRDSTNEAIFYEVLGKTLSDLGKLHVSKR